MRALLRIVVPIALLTGCGWDGKYRYPCQDPVNWESVECQPPICVASDTCTKDLLPEEMTDGPVSTTTP